METEDGETHSGFIESETDAAVILRQPGGIKKSISRPRIKSMKSLPQSAMPEGLEAGLAVGDMADLIEFLVTPAR